MPLGDDFEMSTRQSQQGSSLRTRTLGGGGAAWRSMWEVRSGDLREHWGHVVHVPRAAANLVCQNGGRKSKKTPSIPIQSVQEFECIFE